MKVRWIGLAGVVLIAAAIVGYKAHRPPQSQASMGLPRVLLVADLSEANVAGDSCAEIIQLVRSARDRGIAVQELEPDSQPDLLSRYRVLAIPTVLIFDRNGQVVSRFEGEGRDTVKAIGSALAQLQ